MGGVLSVLFFHGFTKKKKSLRLAVAARSAAGKSSQPLWNALCAYVRKRYSRMYNSLNLFLYYLHEWINDRGRVGELMYKNLFDKKSNEK